jgi:hypothetical protein
MMDDSTKPMDCLITAPRCRRIGMVVVVVVVWIVCCCLMTIHRFRSKEQWEQDVHRSSEKRRITLNIHPRKEPFHSPDFLQPWVQLVVTLIFHTLPPHPESTCPGRCRVATVVVVSPSVSSSPSSCFILRSHQNKQTTTNIQPACVDIILGRASARDARFYLESPTRARRGPVSRFRSTATSPTLETWRNHRDCHFDK